MSGLTAFREAFLSADMLSPADFTAVESRRLRYQLYWALYENTAYRDIHRWATAARVQYGLYRYIRNIYNPAYRLAEFYKSHIWGGQLDLMAGDGVSEPSALPIITDNDSLRTAIGQVWRWSNWQVGKDIATLWGSVMGDVCIKVIDSPDKEKVYLSLVHPASIKTISVDPWGNIKGYEIQETRNDPRNIDPANIRTVTYLETAERDGDSVVYKTYLDGTPYAWSGGLSEWDEPYGFVPMVLIQHNNVGLEWGWSEFHPGFSKFREVDDISSKLSDQIRKSVDSAWLFSGVNKPSKAVTTTGTEKTDERPEPGREEIPALYGPAGATATPLIAPLDIAAVSAYVKDILANIEEDYPELALNVQNAAGDLSGKALKINRQPAETKVLQRRTNYDDALVRAQQMAVAIGGFREYRGFAGFGLESYQAGALDHSIGPRPVFAKDRIDDLETELAFWQTAVQVKSAGYSLDLWLERQGWTAEDIQSYRESPEYQAKVSAIKTLMDTGDVTKKANLPKLRA